METTMGYTNYWNTSNKKKFSPATIGQVKKVLTTYAEKYHEPLVKGFFHKKVNAVVNETHIQFNTTSEDTGEDFYIDLVDGCSEFCKTGRENYDAAVKAVLMVLQSAGNIKSWSFDGHIGEREYKAGVKLLQDAGIKYTDKMYPRG
jgi:hypothetical protein